MKKLLACLLALAGFCASAQQVVNLWPDGAPNSSGIDPAREVVRDYNAENTVNAALYIYLPAQPNGTAILCCPGGGYHALALGHEGKDMAQWFNDMGITYCVLQYRMPGGNCEVPISDVRQAMDYMRAHAEEWGIDSVKIGIMGSSAGGHLAATAANLWPEEKYRPAFQILFYPVISMDKEITHEGSRYGLLGADPSAEQVSRFSMEQQVTERTPEAFIMVSADDELVPVANTLRYATALDEHGVPYSLHVYPTGGHGWGFRDSFTYKSDWTTALEHWLRERIM
ncbi:MAG: alpha/beta hydrolase [Muribaculaceae bacterium]|nr:alpha/beta hydrolase [Muribaculaceae bacterium]